MGKHSRSTRAAGTSATETKRKRHPAAAVEASPDSSATNIGSAQKVLRVLASFTQGPVRQTVEEIASTTGFPRSSTYRYVSLLKEAGFLADDGSGKLEVTSLSVGLARASQQRNSLLAVARPLMLRLTQGSRELGSLRSMH